MEFLENLYTLQFSTKKMRWFFALPLKHFAFRFELNKLFRGHVFLLEAVQKTYCEEGISSGPHTLAFQLYSSELSTLSLLGILKETVEDIVLV